MKRKNRISFKSVLKLIVLICIQLLILFFGMNIRPTCAEEIIYRTETITSKNTNSLLLSGHSHIAIYTEKATIPIYGDIKAKYSLDEIYEMIEVGNQITYGATQSFYGKDEIVTVEYEGIELRRIAESNVFSLLAHFLILICFPQTLLFLYARLTYHPFLKEKLRVRRFEKRRKKKADQPTKNDVCAQAELLHSKKKQKLNAQRPFKPILLLYLLLYTLLILVTVFAFRYPLATQNNTEKVVLSADDIYYNSGYIAPLSRIYFESGSKTYTLNWPSVRSAAEEAVAKMSQEETITLTYKKQKNWCRPYAVVDVRSDSTVYFEMERMNGLYDSKRTMGLVIKIAAWICLTISFLSEMFLAWLFGVKVPKK